MTATIDRTQFLGASEIADVLGMGSGSAYEVWARKRGLLEEKESTPQMRRGSKIEALAVQDFCERRNINPERVDTQVFLTHPAHPFVSATLDLVLSEEAWEFKSTGHHAAKEWNRERMIFPAKHALQNTYQRTIMAASYELDRVGGGLVHFPMETLEGEDFPLEYDPDLGGMLIEAAVKFWQDHVLTGTPPAVTGTSAEAELFKKRFARSDPGIVLVATPEQEALVIEALGLKLDVDKFEKALTAVKLRIQDSMGEASKLVLSDGREVRWQTSKGSPAWKKIAEELMSLVPSFSAADRDALLAHHTPEVGARPFVLPKSGGEEE